jgi:hypothetical protein
MQCDDSVSEAQPPVPASDFSFQKFTLISRHLSIHGIRINMRIYCHAILLLTAGRRAISQAPSLNITAISAFNNASRLECWQLAAPPILGRGAVNFDIGDFDGAFVGIIPPNTTSGTLSNAVQVQ